MTTETLLDRLIAEEGGYSDDPLDHGGPTNFGITAADLGRWRGYGRPATRSEVKALGILEAREIYRQRYVRPFDAIAIDALKAVLVDCAVLEGQSAAIRELQDVLGVAIDGVIGPQTKAAILAMPWRLVVNAFVAARVKHYVGIVALDASQLKWFHGWCVRASSFYV